MTRVVSRIPNDPWLRVPGLFQNPGDLDVTRPIALAIARDLKLRAGQAVALTDPWLVAAARRLDPHGVEFAVADKSMRLWRYDADGKVLAHVSPYPVRRRE
jgi:hypothetical protein